MQSKYTQNTHNINLKQKYLTQDICPSEDDMIAAIEVDTQKIGRHLR